METVKVEQALYLAGIVVFGVCLVGVLAWFGVNYHNWRATRVKAYGCGSAKPTPLPATLKRYHGGMDGFSMYLDLAMDAYDAKTMGTRQTGTMGVCFCGLGPTTCDNGTQCSAYAAKNLPVTYDLDSCSLAIPLNSPCLQTTFSSAFPSVATLQTVVYDAPKDVFHIQALGLKVMTENVVLTSVDPTQVAPCAACSPQGTTKTYCS